MKAVRVSNRSAYGPLQTTSDGGAKEFSVASPAAGLVTGLPLRVLGNVVVKHEYLPLAAGLRRAPGLCRCARFRSTFHGEDFQPGNQDQARDQKTRP